MSDPIIDYPQVKRELIDLHDSGKTIEECNKILNGRYDFVVNGQKVDTLPVFQETINQLQ